MNRLLCIIFLMLPPCAAEEPKDASPQPQPASSRVRIAISGAPQGGTLSIGEKLGSEAVSIKTVAGDSLETIAQKLSKADKEQHENPVFNSIVISQSGDALEFENAVPDFLFMRSTDPGIKVINGVTNLCALASKANNRISLTWSVSNPRPEKIFISRSSNTVPSYALPGTATSFEDADVEHISPVECWYKVTAVTTDPATGISQVSDVATVLVDNPRDMENDVFKVRTNKLPHGVKGKEYHNIRLQKNAGVNPVTWSLKTGKLPPGIVLKSDGRLRGAATASGSFPFTAVATDAKGATVATELTLKINDSSIVDDPSGF